MHFVATREIGVEGFFEVVSQLFRTKQLIATRSMVSFLSFEHDASRRGTLHLFCSSNS
jgi:hypothetical protein